MENIEAKGLNGKLCCGCKACVNICPTNTITTCVQKDGFEYPKVDNEKCLNCKKCLAVCPIHEVPEQFPGCITERTGVSFQGEDSIREKSSSGGLFYYLATDILKKGGIVFGAVFDPAAKAVRHCSTDSCSLDDLMRTKYVQSDMGNTYREVAEQLKLGREVMFSGTPCQAAALRKFTQGIDTENLLIVDFVCHGVPSPGYFKGVLAQYEKERNSDVINVTFREKDEGWRKQVVKIYFADGSVQKEISDYYYYYYAFLNNITLRKSCFTCNFPECHAADITMMDHWSIRGDDNKGVSAFVVNSERGKKAVQCLPKELCGQSNIPLGRLGKINLSHSKISGYKRREKLRDQFFEKYAQIGVTYELDRWLNKQIEKIRREGVIRCRLGSIKQRILRGGKK